MRLFKDNTSSDSTLVSEAEAMKAFTKEQNGRAITWAAMVAFTAVMTFSIVPAAFSQTWSPEEIAEDRAGAEKGEAWAQYNLGVLYDKGYGVPEDDATAVTWYRKAAEQGYAVSTVVSRQGRKQRLAGNSVQRLKLPTGGEVEPLVPKEVTDWHNLRNGVNYWIFRLYDA